MLGSTAKTLADGTANSAVVAAIARSASTSSNAAPMPRTTLTALKKTDAWQQATFVKKGGWAMMPGSEAVEVRRAATYSIRLATLAIVKFLSRSCSRL